jgi:hypothetical protein
MTDQGKSEQDKSNDRQAAKECHSVLDGPACIGGLPKELTTADSRPRKASPSCHSVLDGPECIEPNTKAAR